MITLPNGFREFLPVFTPLLDGTRIRLENVRIIQDAGMQERRIGYKGIIETQTGQRYRVYGRACSLPNCQCDAEIKPEK